MANNEKSFEEKSKQYRGEVLHYMANLDMALNCYLGAFFCGNDQEKISAMILVVLGDDRMSLNAKAQVFHYVASNLDKDWYEGYRSNRPQQHKKPPYSLNQDLVYAIEQRNIFAHRILDEGYFSSDDPKAPATTVRFARFKNSIEGIEYDEEKFNKLMALIINVYYYIIKKVHGLEVFKQ